MSLNPNQARFVEEYLIDCDAGAAAVRAGYGPSGARQQGHRLLKNPDVQAAVAKAQAERSDRVKVDADWVMAKLQLVANRCTAEETFDAKGANGALGLIGKHLGMFVERVELGMTNELADRLAAARKRASAG